MHKGSNGAEKPTVKLVGEEGTCSTSSAGYVER